MSHILILQPADGSKPTKTIKKDGSKVSFDTRQKLWKFIWYEYDNFHHVIEELILADHSTFVLGEPTDWAKDNLENKVLQRTKKPKEEWPNPTILPERQSNQLVLDLDDVYWEDFDCLNPEPAIQKYLDQHEINCHVTWQITSGQKVGSKEARVRLYMEASGDYSLERRKAWCLSCGADSAVYSSNQVIYTASPIYEDGKDPIPKRVGFIKGKFKHLRLPLIDAKEIKQVIRENTYSVEDFDADDLPEEVKSGEVHRRYFMAKAFSLLNRKIKPNHVYAIISMESQTIKSREFDSENVWAYIKDAQNKISYEEKTEEDEIQKEIEEALRSEELPDVEKIPEDVLLPKGSNIEELAMALYESSHKPNKLICAISARAIFAFVAGGKYRSVEGDRLNVQQLTMARTGAGKNVAVRALTSNMSTLFGDEEGREISSQLSWKIVQNTNSTVQGVMDWAGLGNAHDMIFLIDEYGKFLEEASQKGNSNKTALDNMFLEMYSSSDGQYNPRQLSRRGNNEASAMLQAPCFVLSAATTKETFVEAVTGSSVSSGKIARLCVFDADPYIEKRIRPTKFNISEDLQEYMIKLGGTELLYNNMVFRDPDLIAAARVQTPIYIDFAEDVLEYFDEKAEYFDSKVDGISGDIWNRGYENMKRYACIEAVSEDYMNPVVNLNMAKRSFILVKSSCLFLSDLFAEEVGDSDSDRAIKWIYNQYLKKGNNWLGADKITSNRVFRKMMPDAYKRNVLVNSLVNDGILLMKEYSKRADGGGRKSREFRMSDKHFAVEKAKMKARKK